MPYININEYDYTITGPKSIGGNIVAIPILEYLKDKTPSNNNYVVKREEALQGTINININGAKANEFDIYQKYHNLYPNVHIVYGSGVTVEKAYTIKFYNVLADDEITDSIPAKMLNQYLSAISLEIGDTDEPDPYEFLDDIKYTSLPDLMKKVGVTVDNNPFVNHQKVSS